jgi:RNA-directed DNA polymerase
MTHRPKEAEQMTAAQHPAGAASHGEVDWHAIDWRAVHQNVRRLQARIVQATKASRWGKVKALQHLLTHSFSGKALAVRRVTENHGKHTPEGWRTGCCCIRIAIGRHMPKVSR